MKAIETYDLTKSFPLNQVAVSGLDLSLAPGTVYGLMGRNGAGKSTALRLVMGLLKPDRGRACVLGKSMWHADRGHRASIGYVPQHQQLPGRMSIEDLGRYMGRFYTDWDQDALVRLAKHWGMNPSLPVGCFSRGDQRKAALLLAIHPKPLVLILDEPAAGLDAVARRVFLDHLIDYIQLRPESTLLISTHHVGDIARIAQQVGMMDRGRLTRSARLDDLQDRMKKVQVVYPGKTSPSHLQLPGMLRKESMGPVTTAVCELESEQILEGIQLPHGARIQIFPMSLEEIFLELFNNQQMQVKLT
jgi:ABC-2 type transport system ATP-binding protein